MSLKSTFNKYARAYRNIEECHREANKFFSDLELEYSFTYCVGDGVMILDYDRSLCGRISEDQLSRLSMSKNRDQAIDVLSEINFNC